MRIGLVLGLCLIVSACDTPLFEPAGKPARKEITVTRNDISLAGPDGFCVDSESSTLSETDAFVVFGNCDAISERASAKDPVKRAVVTISVTERGDGASAISDGPDKLAAFFKTEDGRKTLSTTGTPSDIQTIDSYAKDNIVYLRVSDRTGGETLGLSDLYWRAYFDAKSSIIAISVLGFPAAPLSEEDGMKILRGFTEKTKATASKTARPAAQTDPVALFRRLFN